MSMHVEVPNIVVAALLMVPAVAAYVWAVIRARRRWVDPWLDRKAPGRLSVPQTYGSTPESRAVVDDVLRRVEEQRRRTQ